jgi:hypothetical protein
MHRIMMLADVNKVVEVIIADQAKLHTLRSR